MFDTSNCIATTAAKRNFSSQLVQLSLGNRRQTAALVMEGKPKWRCSAVKAVVKVGVDTVEPYSTQIR